MNVNISDLSHNEDALVEAREIMVKFTTGEAKPAQVSNCGQWLAFRLERNPDYFMAYMVDSRYKNWLLMTLQDFKGRIARGVNAGFCLKDTESSDTYQGRDWSNKKPTI